MKSFQEIIQLIENQRYASDELYQFCQSKRWEDAPKLDYKMAKRLAPHADFYLSGLRPLFLFESDTFDQLRVFSLVQARDGVRSLLNFFLKNPTPEGLRTKLLIHKHLAPIIPRAWSEQVALYQQAIRPKPLPMKQEKPQLIISMLSTPQQFSLDFLEEKLTKIAAEYKGPYHILLSENLAFLDEDLSRDEKTFQFKVQQRIHQFLGEQAQFINWEQVDSLELHNCHFIDIDQYHFHYLDSFAQHHLIGQGAIPFDMPLIQESSDEHFAVPISAFEEIQIFSFQSQDYSISEELSRLAKTSLKNEISQTKDKNFEIQTQGDFEEVSMQKIKFCSPEFDSFAFEVAKRLI